LSAPGRQEHVTHAPLPRVRQRSEAVDVNRGQLVYPSLKDVPVESGFARARPSRWAGRSVVPPGETECLELLLQRLPRHVNGCPSRPEGLKLWQSAKGAHHIETTASSLWSVAAKADRKSSLEMAGFKRWYRDHLGLKFGNGSLEPAKVGVVCNNDDVGVSTKLRSAVHHASLPTHEQISDAILLQRRKDSAAKKGL